MRNHIRVPLACDFERGEESLSRKRRRPTILSLFAMGLFAALPAQAQNFNNIEYLCADWGPAMTLPSKQGEKPAFSETKEEIYFLKQVTFITRKMIGKHDALSGRDYVDEGRGISIYLCKMKPDGSEKMEIKELWSNPNYPIDTQGQSTWMDVNEKTRKIALAIAYAGSDLTGLWTVNLDGSELKRIITPERNQEHLQTINHCSWASDGRWIVFEEELRGMSPNRFNISECERDGRGFKRMLVGTENEAYRHPSVSPDGRLVVFAKYPNYRKSGARHIWLMDIDNGKARPLPNPDSPRWNVHGGNYPAWSPDGKRILYSGITATVVTVSTGEAEHLGLGGEGTWGWPHWGKLGIVGHAVRGLLMTDPDFKEAKLLGPTHLEQCEENENAKCRW